MGILGLFTPLVQAVGRLGGDSVSPARVSLAAQPGAFVASVDGRDWQATDISVQLDGPKAFIRTVNSLDNSALNIEFSVKNSIEAMYKFVPSLRTMMVTGKENALLYLPADSRSALDFLTTVGSVGKPGSIQIIGYDPLRRTVTGRFAAVVGSGKKLLRITGSFNQLKF